MNAYAIAQYLAANAIGQFAGNSDWSIHVASEPMTPDNAITVYDLQSSGVETDSQDVFTGSLQVRVRSEDYQAGLNKHKTIRSLLIENGSFTSNGIRFIGVNLVNGPWSLGRDDQDRFVTVASYATLTEEEAE